MLFLKLTGIRVKTLDFMKKKMLEYSLKEFNNILFIMMKMIFLYYI